MHGSWIHYRPAVNPSLLIDVKTEPPCPARPPGLWCAGTAPDTHPTTTMRIAIGGFQHETNTFAPSKATYEQFRARRRLAGPAPWWRDPDTMVADRNLPIAGFIEEMRSNPPRESTSSRPPPGPPASPRRT